MEDSIPLPCAKEVSLKKSTFIGNFVAWVVVAAASIAFLAWYHLTDPDTVLAATDSPLVQTGMVLAAPLLLFAMGVVIGLLLLWFKHILMGRGARLACRVVAILSLVFILLAAVPVVVTAAAESFLGPAVIVVYVTMAAPILIMMLGFVYALGCAGVDASKKGPFAKYLPDDEKDGRAA